MSKIKKFKFDGEPQRLDAYLTGELDGWSRSLVKSLIEKGLVTVNGDKHKPSYLLKPEDEIKLTQNSSTKEKGKLKPLLIFEDKHVLAVSKPFGLLVHPLNTSWERMPETVFESGETLTAILLADRPELATNGVTRLGLVHRLDKETSGVMVIAKTVKAQESLTAQFHDRQVEKTYVGIVNGRLENKTGTINAPVGRESGDKRVKVTPLGKEAFTGYKTIRRQKEFSLVEMYPKTGRTNQLRVHFAWLGHPVVGDSLYGGPSAERLMLHSKTIKLTHPVTKKKIVFSSNIPKDIKG
jgi:23S rRNA pseudouridine1911/1915/1917 synthase